MLAIQRKITRVNFTNRNTKPKYIVIHYVGAVSSAKNNADYFYNAYRGASAHYFVDENSIWQVVEDTDTAWSVGGSNAGGRLYGVAKNSNTLNIEMCVKKKDGKWFYEPKTLDNVADLVKTKMKEYGIPASNVIRHYDVTGKTCPGNYINEKAWNDLHAKLTCSTVSKPKPTPSNKDIEVDGVWGPATTKLAQKVFGTPVDGIVSNQYKAYKDKNKGLSSSTFEWETTPGKSGSVLIKAIQKKVGVEADGHIGPKTIKAMQKWLGTTQDGYVSRPSVMVKAFQRWLNKQ